MAKKDSESEIESMFSRTEENILKRLDIFEKNIIHRFDILIDKLEDFLKRPPVKYYE